MKYLTTLVIALLVTVSIVRFGALPSRVQAWTNGVIPYEFDSDMGAYQIKLIKRAMRVWESGTGVKFVRDSKALNRLVIKGGGDVCQSHVGMINGPQDLDFSKYCGYRTALHELGHALGLGHEHQRFDRDFYIKINPKCFENEKVAYDFTKRQPLDSPVLGGYDYDSIMHYNPYSFSKGVDCKTIYVLQPNVRIGYTAKLSEMDIRRVKFMYYWRFSK